MLSEETTLGDYPMEAVKMMTRIALEIEKDIKKYAAPFHYNSSKELTDVVSQSAVLIGRESGAKYLVALTKSGRTARMIARYRPNQPILSLMSNQKEAGRLMLAYGCYPVIVPKLGGVEDIMNLVRKVSTGHDFAKKGDKVVIVAGMPVGKAKETNMVLVETI
jgi:pyruvate kinase